MDPNRQPGGLARAALRRIDRYRHSGGSSADVCRFTPSCSHYADEALRTRALPVALLLIAWRLLRCNPFMHRRVADPVRRPHRWRLRPNTLPTMLSILALSGFVVVVTAGIAEAVGVNGGCTASINGHDPSALTSDHPLVVHKGESVGVTGTIPSSVPNPSQVASNTHIEVEVVVNVFGVTSSDHPGHGPQWGGTQNVDNYLKYGVGLYHVIGHASGTGGWSCDGDAYVQLKDGNALGKPIGGAAAGLTVLGLLGAAYASTAPQPDANADYITPPGGEERAAENEATSMVRDSGDNAIASLGCLLLILIAIGIAFIGDGWFGMSAVAGPGLGSNKGRRIWSHGHPIVGFISGLLLGIGVTVLMQQFAVWPLTIMTAIVFPILTAVICSLRGWLGRSFRQVSRSS